MAPLCAGMTSGPLGMSPFRGLKHLLMRLPTSFIPQAQPVNQREYVSAIATRLHSCTGLLKNCNSQRGTAWLTMLHFILIYPFLTCMEPFLPELLFCSFLIPSPTSRKN